MTSRRSKPVTISKYIVCVVIASSLPVAT